jgi:hypothetical protein
LRFCSNDNNNTTPTTAEGCPLDRQQQQHNNQRIMSKSKGGKGKAAFKKDTKSKPVRRTTKRTTTTITTTGAASTTMIVKKSPPVPFEWKTAFILGVELHDPVKEVLQQAHFVFPDIHQLVVEHHPGCDVYVYNCVPSFALWQVRFFIGENLSKMTNIERQMATGF